MAVCNINEKILKRIKSDIRKSSNVPTETLATTLIQNYNDIEALVAVIEEYKQNIEYLNDTQKDFLEKFGNEEDLRKFASEISQVKNTDKILSNPSNMDWIKQPVEEIFKLSPASYSYLINQFTTKIFQCVYINNTVPGGLEITEKEANRNIANYLNSLFSQVLEFIGEPEYKLFNNSNFEQNYQVVINKAVAKASQLDLSQISSISSKKQLDQICALISLTKFDELLKSKFQGLIKIPSQFDGYLVQDKISKYSVVEDAVKMMIYQDGDERRFISSNVQSNFFKLWASTIPVVDSKGNIIKGKYLTANQIQVQLGLLQRDSFFKFYKETSTNEKRGIVLNFQTDAEGTLETIFTNKFFENEISGNIVLRSLQQYFYTGTKNTFSIKQLTDNYRSNVSVNTNETNLFNVLAFEASKSNSPILLLTEINNGKAEYKELDLQEKTNKSKLRVSIQTKILQDKKEAEESTKQPNPLVNYYFQTEDGKEVSLASSQSTVPEQLIFKSGKEIKKVSLSSVLSSEFGIPKKDLDHFIRVEDQSLNLLAKLIQSINELYKQELDFTKSENELLGELKINDVVLNIADKLYINEFTEVRMQTLNGNKDSIPVSRLYSPMFSSLKFIDTFTENFGKDGCIFSKYIDLFTNANNEHYKANIAVNVDINGKSYKTAQSLTPKEALQYEINFGFVQSFKTKKFIFQPVAYSDKSTIFNIIVNLAAKYNKNKDFSELSIKELEDIYFNVQKTFYDKIKEKIVSNWSEVFGVKMSSLKDVEDQFDSLNKKYGKGAQAELQKRIREAFDKNHNLEIVEERDFSIYNKEIHLNKMLKHHISLYENKTKWLQDQLKNYSSFMKYINENNIKFFNNIKDINAVLASDIAPIEFKETPEDPYFDITSLSTKIHNSDVNPFFYKYLIMKNMFTDSYLNMSVGHPWIHKGKFKAINKDLIDVLDKIGYEDNLSLNDFVQSNEFKYGSSLYGDYIRLFKYAKDNGIVITKDNIDSTIQEFELSLEINSRNNTSQKRNNSLTATSEPYLTNSYKTISESINVCIVDDHLAKVFNPNGSYDDGLKATDGSIYVPGWAAKLMENSLPARGQRGVQKNITLHVGAGYGSQIKDAQQIISNELIRLSAYEQANTLKKVDWKKVIEKMCGYQDFSQFDLTSLNVSPKIIAGRKLYYNYQGKHYEVLNLQKVDELGNYNIKVTEVNINGNSIEGTENIIQQNIKSIYDLWQVFGGEYSEEIVDGVLQFSESSMEAVANYMSFVKNSLGENILRKDLIDMLAFTSAVKNGIVNRNKADDVLYSNSTGKMMYFKMALSYCGLQNDKNHAVNEDSIREMSQVISALASGNETTSLANEAYDDIAKFTKSQIEKFARLYQVSLKQKTEKFYKELSEFIVKAFSGAQHISGGNAIAELMKEKDLFVTSDPQIYNKFVSSFISELNNSAIKRKYTGLAGILCPSDGAVQVLEKNGVVYLMSDIFRKVLSDINLVNSLRESLINKGITEIHNEDLIKEYISQEFADTLILDQSILRLGDVVQIRTLDSKGEYIKIDDPIILQTYQNYQLQEGEQLWKINSITRDLKPAEHTWKINGKTYNIWTSPLVTLNFKIQNSKKITDKEGNVTSWLKTNSSITNSQNSNNQEWEFTVDELAIMQYLGPNLSSNSISNLLKQYTVALSEGRGIADGTWADKLGNLNAEIFSVLDVITDYKIAEAEAIFPNTYFEKMGTQGKTVSEIINQGEDFFKQGINDAIQTKSDKADIIVSTDNQNYEIIISGIESLLKNKRYAEVNKNIGTELDLKNQLWVLNENNEKEYILESGITRVIDTDTSKEYIVIDPALFTDQNKAIKFFKQFNSVLSILPVLKSLNSTNRELYVNILKICKKTNPFDFRNLFIREINNFNLINNNLDELKKGLRNKLTDFVTKEYTSKLAKERFTTFKQTLYTLSSRIPAQSLQSFMAMKIAGFTQNQLNNIYVSRWQIWIQGSDFDIDVAYDLMYNIDKIGRYRTTSPLADITSDALFKASKTLPKPNQSEIIGENEVNLINKNINFTNADIVKTIIALPNGKFNLVNEAVEGAQLVESKEENNNTYALGLKQSQEIHPGLLEYTKEELIDLLPQFTFVNKVFYSSKNTATNLTQDVINWYRLKDRKSEIDKLKLIEVYKNVLNKINNSFSIFIDSNQVSRALGENGPFDVIETISDFIDTVNFHNGNRIHRKARQNEILDRIRDVSNDIRNMQASYISVDEGTTIIKKVINDLGLENSLGQIHDGSFIFKMQEANYVGKKTVGIFANGLKGYFALKNFYNKYKKPFHKLISIPLEDSEDSLKNGDTPFEVNALADTLQDTGGYKKTDIILSALLSLATDNAKELGLAKINAGMEFAGSYAYLTIMGVPIETSIKFFTSPIIRRVTELTKGNLFYDSQKLSVQKGINIARNEEEEALKLENITPEEISKHKFNIKQLNALEAIYESAQELRAFTEILSVNQGLKNKSNELIVFKQHFSNQILNRFSKEKQANVDAFVKNISLKRKIDPIKVFNIISKAEKTGIINIKDKRIVFKNIDFDKFFLNKEYQKVVSLFYELIQDTFNLYECVSNLPVFNEVLTSSATFDRLLQESSIKHRISSSTIDRLINYNKELPKNAFVGKSILKTLTEKQIKMVQTMIEHKLISQWLATSPKLIKFRFNKADILRLVKAEVSVEDNVNFDLKTSEGIMMFKNLMEKIIIPKILKQDQSLEGNDFVDKLQFYHDPYSKGDWYKLNVNLSSLNTGGTQELNASLLKGYNDLRYKQAPVPSIKGLTEFTWGDLIYVYNMIANKNQYGPQRMTAVFEQQIKEDPLALDYLRFLSRIEKGQISFDLDYNELLFALYNKKGNLTLSEKYTEQDFSFDDSEDDDTTSQDKSEDPDIKPSEKEKVKEVKSFEYTLSHPNLSNGFMNQFKVKKSDEINEEVRLNDSELRQKLLEFILNRQVLVQLNCN